jgi:hypothetical protein
VSAPAWSHFRACDKCAAGQGEPCLKLSGRNSGPVEVEADRPHGGRKLLKRYAEEADRG